MSSRSHDRPRASAPTKKIIRREYVSPTTLSIGPRWSIEISANYNPSCPPALRLALAADDGGRPLILFLRGDETRRLIEALSAAERGL